MFLYGLSPRALNIVTAFQYKSKADVKWNIEAGILNEKNVKNLGEGTFKEICNWCLAYPPNVPPRVQKAINLLVAYGYKVSKE